MMMFAALTRSMPPDLPLCDSLTWDLLWTNPNPSASFGPQTIPIDLSGYRLVFVQSNQATTIVGIDNVTAEIGANFAGVVRSRGFRATSDGVIVFAGYNGSSVDNNNIIPLAIYGIR